MLKDAEPACAYSEQVKPLHYNEIYEVDRRSDGEFRGDEISIEVVRDRAILEPEDREGDPLALEIPESHGKGGDRFEDTDKCIGLHHELPVDETVHLGIAWAAEEDVGLWCLVRKNNRSSTVCEAADDNHQERRQDLREAEDDIAKDGPELGKGSRGE
jgi:hypothetical protein